MSEAAVSVRALRKTYGRLGGKVHALRGVTMDVPRGSIFGLLGPNGAGKSTLVKILITAVRRSGGGGSLLGEPIGRKAVLRRVGYLPEHHNLPGHLTGRQVVEFFGALGMLPRAQRRRRANELLDLVGMRDWHNKKVGGYSKGMRQRIGIAQALVADPELVILDEPTDGVDPVGRRDIRQILQRMRDEGRTVFINSHLLGELEMVCDAVGIMHKGRVVSMGTIESLTEGTLRYEVQTDHAQPMPLVAGVLNEKGTLVGGESVEAHGNRLWIGTTDAGAIQPVLDAIRAGGGVIREVRTHRPSLEDLFMRAVADDDSTGGVRGSARAGEGAGQS